MAEFICEPADVAVMVNAENGIAELRLQIEFSNRGQRVSQHRGQPSIADTDFRCFQLLAGELASKIQVGS